MCADLQLSWRIAKMFVLERVMLEFKSRVGPTLKAIRTANRMTQDRQSARRRRAANATRARRRGNRVSARSLLQRNLTSPARTASGYEQTNRPRQSGVCLYSPNRLQSAEKLLPKRSGHRRRHSPATLRFMLQRRLRRRSPIRVHECGPAASRLALARLSCALTERLMVLGFVRIDQFKQITCASAIRLVPAPRHTAASCQLETFRLKSNAAYSVPIVGACSTRSQRAWVLNLQALNS
jgi:hypothetical protein